MNGDINMENFSEERIAGVARHTHETIIELKINLDGSGRNDISSGVGFFDHMLAQIGKHGFFDLFVNVKGDLDVDCHHTVEDVGIVLGQGVAEALGEKVGLRRYGSAIVPMDDALA